MCRSHHGPERAGGVYVTGLSTEASGDGRSCSVGASKPAIPGPAVKLEWGHRRYFKTAPKLYVQRGTFLIAFLIKQPNGQRGSTDLTAILTSPSGMRVKHQTSTQSHLLFTSPNIIKTSSTSSLFCRLDQTLPILVAPQVSWSQVSIWTAS